MEKFRCLLCGGEQNSLVKLRTRDSDHKVVKCLSCGLQQLYPLPSVEEDAEYYDKNAHDKGVTPSFTIEDIYQKFKFQNETRIAYLKRFGLRKEWKMLDYASGYGFFIEQMQREGLNFDGIEISAERLEICRERLGEHFRNIYNVNLLLQDVPANLKEKYDLITMFHLLEHISKPKELLSKVSMLLKAGGGIGDRSPQCKQLDDGCFVCV